MTTDKDLLEFKKFLLQKQSLKVPLNNLPFKPVKFHHNQKIKIIQGYYASFKGYIKGHRVNKDNNNEYDVLIKFRDEVNVWLPEEYLKIAWF